MLLSPPLIWTKAHIDEFIELTKKARRSDARRCQKVVGALDSAGSAAANPTQILNNRGDGASPAKRLASSLAGPDRRGRVIAAAIAMGLGELGRFYWLFELGSHFLVQYPFGLAIAAAYFLLRARWRWLLVAAMLAIVPDVATGVLCVIRHQPRRRPQRAHIACAS